MLPSTIKASGGGRTALTSSSSSATASSGPVILSPWTYPNEPSLRVTPSHASLPTLHNLIYITDSTIDIPELELERERESEEDDLTRRTALSIESSGGGDNSDDHAEPGPSRLAIDSRSDPSPELTGRDFPHDLSDRYSSEGSDAEQGEWHCDCTEGSCGSGDGDHCDCVATFGNFYTSGIGSESAGIANLDALPERLPLVECGPVCPCGDSCMNRITQRGLRIPIHVRPLNSDVIGLGAFYAPEDDRPLTRGTFICLYAGEYLTTTQAKDRWNVKHNGAGEGNYILTLRLPGQRIHIDPRYKGNVGRFFNHSCDPNCVVHVVRWGGSSIWPRAAVFVKREIQPGEQLTYDYANASGGPAVAGSEGVTKGTTRCLCGSVNCRGWMPYDPDV